MKTPMTRLTHLTYVLIFSAIFNTSAAAECFPLTPGEVRVVDGDTVHALGEKWRLTRPSGGYDTPETYSPKCYAEELLGKKATERLRELVEGGELVICTDGERDRYGRFLGHLSAQGRDVGETLISENLAQPWPRTREWCGDE